MTSSRCSAACEKINRVNGIHHNVSSSSTTYDITVLDTLRNNDDQNKGCHSKVFTGSLPFPSPSIGFHLVDHCEVVVLDTNATINSERDMKRWRMQLSMQQLFTLQDELSISKLIILQKGMHGLGKVECGWDDVFECKALEN